MNKSIPVYVSVKISLGFEGELVFKDIVDLVCDLMSNKFFKRRCHFGLTIIRLVAY